MLKSEKSPNHYRPMHVWSHKPASQSVSQSESKDFWSGHTYYYLQLHVWQHAKLGVCSTQSLKRLAFSYICRRPSLLHQVVFLCNLRLWIDTKILKSWSLIQDTYIHLTQMCCQKSNRITVKTDTVLPLYKPILVQQGRPTYNSIQNQLLQCLLNYILMLWSNNTL